MLQLKKCRKYIAKGKGAKICNRIRESHIYINNVQMFLLECDPGWICYLSSCLKVSLLPSTWRQAAKTCSEQGSHLFSIQENYNCLWEFLYLECGKEQFFIGLLSTPAGRSDYSYRWSDGSPFAYSDWKHLDAHCPTELCKTITPYASVISWTSVDCSSSYRFICEKPKSETRYRALLI